MTSAVNLNNYIFKIKDLTSKIFEFDTEKNQDSNTIRQLVLKDSIFEMYPSAQFVFNDKLGTNYLNSPFIERQQVEIEMGIYNSDLRLKHNFYWGRNVLTDVQLSKNIGGKIINPFISDYKYYDESKTETYPALTPSLVASNIVATMGTPPAKPFLTPTVNSRNWHQGNRNYTSFFKEVLCKHAKSEDNSPFVSYFNLANEFHFRSVSSLYKETPSPPPRSNQGATMPDKYTIDFSDSEYTYNRKFVQSVNQLEYLGNAVNHNLYGVEFTHINKVHYTNIKKYIKDYKVIPNNAYPLRNDPFRSTKVNQNIYLGVFNTKDLKSKDGLINSHFLNTMFPLRMNITIFFDPYQVAGRSIELDVFDPTGEKNQILSGKWLIVESIHNYNHIDGIENRVIYTGLQLAKSGLDIIDKDRLMV